MGEAPTESGARRAERWGSQLLAHARGFEARFGDRGEPTLFFSPGRVNLMGAHLDYNGGPVMPTAIDRGTFIAARPTRTHTLRLASTLDGAMLEIDLGSLARGRQPKTGSWFDYPLGVVLEIEDALRLGEISGAPHGLEILFGGNLPVGAGLSSSASICVGTGFVLDRMWNLGMTRMRIVHAALRAEREFVGVHCGIMDPYSVGLAREGQLLWLDCKDGSSAYLPIDPGRHAIAVADTLVRRELAQVAFNERVRQCREAFEALRHHQPDATCLRDIGVETFEEHRKTLDPIVAMRAEHVVREVARTFAAREALSVGDVSGLGSAMFRAHESLRDLFEVSVPELDHLVESAADCPGVLGARLTGAGFGGCVVMLVDAEAGESCAERIAATFQQRFGRRPVIELFGGDAGPREIAGPLEA